MPPSSDTLWPSCLPRRSRVKPTPRNTSLDLNKCWITIMPGSRVKEVRMNLPTMLDAATLLGAGFEFLLPVAPTLDREFLEQSTRGRGITLVSEALPALHHARAAIVASGTATVEAAMMATPFVMVYRVSALTYTLGKPRIKVPYFAMVNLIAGEKIVPELVQDDFTAERVVARLKELIAEGPARRTMLDGLARVKAQLRSPDSGDTRPAAERAAQSVLDLVGRPRLRTCCCRWWPDSRGSISDCGKAFNRKVREGTAKVEKRSHYRPFSISLRPWAALSLRTLRLKAREGLNPCAASIFWFKIFIIE